MTQGYLNKKEMVLLLSLSKGCFMAKSFHCVENEAALSFLIPICLYSLIIVSWRPPFYFGLR